MNQELAKRLMVEGATFILLDVPQGTEFGIDMKSWTTGENFKGVKMIPPGVHYVFYSSVSVTGDVAPRIGFFYHFKKSEFVVKKWDKDIETISSELIPEKLVVSLKQNITLLDKFLGPYPYDIWERWKSLSSHVTEDLCKKLMPLTGEVRSALELTASKEPENIEKDAKKPGLSKSQMWYCSSHEEDIENGLLPDLKPKAGTDLRFTKFPTKMYPDGASPTDITKHCLDSSYCLDLMVTNYTNPIDIMGEMEFCYICFLVGHSLEAFEHWKRVVSLLCSCQIAIKKYRNLYDVFASLLEIQVKEIPEEFLADIVTNNNFVYVKLRQLFSAVGSSDVEGRLKTKMERFKESLTESYMWDFSHLDSDDEDEQPVVVII